MDSQFLREKHPAFIFNSFEYETNNKVLHIKFHFILEPDINFYPTLEIPVVDAPQNLDGYIFNLGLVELVSYWKAACSPKIVIKAGRLTSRQIDFWKELLINGLGEFFYQNKVNFSVSNFLSIKSDSNSYFGLDPDQDFTGDLILMGGGKDSAVTAEAVKNMTKRNNVLLLNPTIAAKKTSAVAGFESPIVVNRTIDSKLLQLNEQGYLNGHTPFSAYLSFLSTLVAKIHKFKNVIVSNEQSAGEANLKYIGLSVNHQYSKSYHYEALFRDYARAYLNKSINYFSFLRPLNELQITSLFLKTEKYDNVFNSCNIGRNVYWCGACPKCAFVYLLFSALASRKRVEKIFGPDDFFANQKIKQHIKDLTGDGAHKPLDCVGTEEESRMALKLLKYPEYSKIRDKIKKSWHNENFLPKEYEKLLKGIIYV